jgi:carboxymethylenebutenolidase
MTIRLTSADGFQFPAYVATPKHAPKAAVVVLQEIFGVNAHIREVADGYAAAGYLAIAPATFHRAKPGVELGLSLIHI